MLKICNIVGARPNFMKIAPIHRRMLEAGCLDVQLVHTGQHYDDKMSRAFFHDLGMPEPDLHLGVGSGTHAQQTAAVLLRLEKVLLERRPDWIVVVGDVNSTLAAALVAAKLHIPVAHVEAGLRSLDRTMPEEINRILTDSVGDLLFVSEPSGLDHLNREGISSEKIHFVGNVMIDSLVEHLPRARASGILEKLNLQPKGYALLTLHRPSNVDHYVSFADILAALEEIQRHIPIVFPIHPRTRKMIFNFRFEDDINRMENFHLVDPLGYLPFLNLTAEAKFVLTDSGGIQEESTFLNIPCLTLRENTERPVTVDVGTNRLVGTKSSDIIAGAEDALNGKLDRKEIPPLWDGQTSRRIVDILTRLT